jgi:hypothetical protein
MSYGHLYIEFIVTFPKKGAFSVDKLAKVLNVTAIKSEGYSKVKKNKILEDYR